MERELPSPEEWFWRDVRLEREVGAKFADAVAGRITLRDPYRWYLDNTARLGPIVETDAYSNLLLQRVVELMEQLHDEEVRAVYVQEPEVLQRLARKLLGQEPASFLCKPAWVVTVNVDYERPGDPAGDDLD